MSVTILAVGDLHLGRRSKHLPAGVSSEISSPIYTWRRIVDEAIRREVDLLCLTGDIVDESNKYFEAFGPLIRGLRRLDEHGVSTYLVAGNHDFDVLGELVDQADASNVRLLGRGGTWEFAAVDHPELPLTIAGWSFPERHYDSNPLDAVALGGSSERPTIGLLHCDLDNGESRYAPVAAADLVGTRVDCWLLGHIHSPVRTSEEPVTLYTGSPHALDNGEQGVHGPWLVTVHSPHRIETEQLALSPVRYERLAVDVSSIETREEWRAAIVSTIEDHLEASTEETRYTELLMYDVELEGRTSRYEAVGRWIDGADIQEFSYVADGTAARIHRIGNSTRPAIGSLVDLARQEHPAGYLARIIHAIEEEDDSSLVSDLVSRLNSVFRRIDTSSTYAPLRTAAPLDGSEQAVKEQLLERSRELLAALVEQKEETA